MDQRDLFVWSCFSRCKILSTVTSLGSVLLVPVEISPNFLPRWNPAWECLICYCHHPHLLPLPLLVYLVIHPDEGVHILDVSLPGLLHHFGQHGLAHPLPVDWLVRADEGYYSLPTSCVCWESQSDECRDHYSRSAHSIQLQPEKGLKFEDCYFIMTIWSASHHQHVVVVGDEGKSLTFLHKHLVEIIGRFCDRQYWEEFLVDIPVVWHQHKSLPKVWVTSADRLGPS